MKGLKFIASILVASMLIGCGTPPKTEEEVDVTALQNDNQFNYVLAGFLQEYSEARLDFAIIFSVDVESIGLEEWKKLIDENQEQWEKVEFYGGLLTDYLTEKEAWIKTAHAHEGADLNELVEHGLVDPSVIDETYEEPDFGEGDHLMVDVEKDMDSGVGSGELGFYEEVLMVANDAEKGRILKDIVEKMGAFDAKMAQEWLEEANKLYVEQEAKNEIKYEKFEKLSEKVRNSAIFAGLAGFTIGGLYITGAGLLGASGTAGVGHMLTSAGFSIGTMEFLLSFGEHGAYLLDNREGQEYFATQQEEMNKFFKEAKFVISVKNLLTGKLPNAKDFSVEDIPDFIDNVKFVVGLNKAIESPIPEEMAKKLKEIEENRINQLEKLLPPGGYLYEETPVEEIEVEELPEAEELVEGPTVESLRIGRYETPYEIDDILTKQTGGGTKIRNEWDIFRCCNCYY